MFFSDNIMKILSIGECNNDKIKHIFKKKKKKDINNYKLSLF